MSAAGPAPAFRFDGKAAVVTGGARGIGRGIAERLAVLALAEEHPGSARVRASARGSGERAAAEAPRADALQYT